MLLTVCAELITVTYIECKNHSFCVCAGKLKDCSPCQLKRQVNVMAELKCWKTFGCCFWRMTLKLEFDFSFLNFMEQYLQCYRVAILCVTDSRVHLFKEPGLPEAQTSTNAAASSKQHCITALLVLYNNQNTTFVQIK